MQDDLLGIDSLEGSTPKDVFGAYSIDVKNIPKKDGVIKPNVEGQPVGYEEDPDFYAQNTEQHTHDGVNSKPIPFQRISGFLETLTSTPTYRPRSISEQIKIVDIEDDDRIYFYDRLSRKWKFVTLLSTDFETQQLQLPVASTGDFGWDVAGAGADSIPFSNGSEMFSSSLEFEFFSKIIGIDGVLDFSFSKKIKFETVISPRFTDATNEGSIGFYENNSDTPTDLSDLSNIVTSIRWVMQGSSLYAVWADGTTVNTQLISGVTVAVGNGMTLKIVVEPGVSIKWFVDDALVLTSTTDLPNTGALFIAVSGRTSNAGKSGYYVHFPKLSLEN